MQRCANPDPALTPASGLGRPHARNASVAFGSWVCEYSKFSSKSRRSAELGTVFVAQLDQRTQNLSIFGHLREGSGVFTQPRSKDDLQRPLKSRRLSARYETFGVERRHLRGQSEAPAQSPVALEIPLPAHRLFARGPRFGIKKRPGASSCRTRAFAGIVLGETALKIKRPTYIGPVAARSVAPKNVDKCHHFHRPTRNPSS